MEVKNEKQKPERECFVMDRTTGEIFRMTEREITLAQKKVNAIASEKGYFTYEQVLEIITKNWPEDVKNDFFKRRRKREGWGLNDEKATDLLLNRTRMDDGVLLIDFTCDFTEKNEAD